MAHTSMESTWPRATWTERRGGGSAPAAGPGAVFGPHVRGWNVDGGAAAAIPAVSFMAYGTNRWGVVVACGDLDGDGIDEILTAPGPSAQFGADVLGWNFDG